MDVISVVIPIYHVAAYMRRSIDSVLNQTYKNLEIILVDDGGDDECPQICDEYAQKDLRIKVIHKENGGLSDARNAGVKIATGKYLAFLDSDDYIAEDTYEKMLETLKKNQADIVVCNYESVTDAGIPIPERNNNMSVKERLYTSREAIEKLCGPDYHYWVTAWNRLYKIEIVKKVQFPKGKIHEDEFTAHLFYDAAEKIMGMEEAFYKYVIREDSIMTKKYSKKNLAYVEALHNRIMYCMDHDMEITGIAFLRWMSKYLLKVYNKLDLKDPETKEAYHKQVQAYLQLYHTIKKQNDVGKMAFLSTMLLKYLPGIGNFIVENMMK